MKDEDYYQSMDRNRKCVEVDLIHCGSGSIVSITGVKDFVELIDSIKVPEWTLFKARDGSVQEGLYAFHDLERNFWYLHRKQREVEV